MRTKTQTKTKSVTNTKLAIATLVLMASGAAALATLPLQRINWTPPCTDSDGGVNYYTRGTVVFNTSSTFTSSTDVCATNMVLTEKSCGISGVAKAISSQNYACERSCLNGACLIPEHARIMPFLMRDYPVQGQCAHMRERLMGVRFQRVLNPAETNRDAYMKSIRIRLQGSVFVASTGANTAAITLDDGINPPIVRNISRVDNGMSNIVDFPVNYRIPQGGTMTIYVSVDLSDAVNFQQQQMYAGQYEIKAILDSYTWNDGFGKSDQVANAANGVPLEANWCMF